MVITEKKVNYLVADTTAFIQNTPLQDIAHHVVTVQEVVNEITNKRQLRRLVVLPYELLIKDVFAENVQIITEFTKKTGDYPTLSATDIKVMALTYQLEKEHVGTQHLRKEPIVRSTINISSKPRTDNIDLDMPGFYMPKPKSNSRTESESETREDACDNDLAAKANSLNIQENINYHELEHKTDSLVLPKEHLCKPEDNVNVCPESKHKADDLLLATVHENLSEQNDIDLDLCLEAENESYDLILPKAEEQLSETSDDEQDNVDDDDSDGWITPSNVHEAKKQLKQISSNNLEEKFVQVACLTTDFAMQNVLKQMNLNVSAIDGRIIKQLKTYILRCYSCFKTTSIMTKSFCPKCGNNTLKRVSVSVDGDGKQKIYINTRRPLTARGKKFSLPTPQGGKHSKNPILFADQPVPDQRPTRLARTKYNPLNDDYIAGFSPFIMHDVDSKSAQLGIRPGKEVKHWMKKNPNEARRKKK